MISHFIEDELVAKQKEDNGISAKETDSKVIHIGFVKIRKSFATTAFSLLKHENINFNKWQILKKAYQVASASTEHVCGLHSSPLALLAYKEQLQQLPIQKKSAQNHVVYPYISDAGELQLTVEEFEKRFDMIKKVVLISRFTSSECHVVYVKKQERLLSKGLRDQKLLVHRTNCPDCLPLSPRKKSI